MIGLLGVVDFLKSARKIDLLIDPDSAECITTTRKEGRKEGKEGGRQRERASQSSGDKKRHTLYDLSLEIHHLVGRSGEHGRIQHRKALFCVVVSWCGFYSYYPLMRAHSFLVVLLLRKTSIHITKLDLKKLLFKCSFRWEPSQYPKCFVFQTLFFFFIKRVK